ncbi:hypothetical protein AVEN_221470-1, partial [Araneus ventricosus]
QATAGSVGTWPLLVGVDGAKHQANDLESTPKGIQSRYVCPNQEKKHILEEGIVLFIGPLDVHECH